MDRQSHGRALKAGLFAIVLGALASGCGGFVHDEPLDQSYRLVAVDLSGDMMVCRRFGDASCSGDELPGPTVFAAGANSKYVTIARHPKAGGQINRTVTEYYYVIRPPETALLRSADVVGPLDQPQFDAARNRLGLPGFAKVFADLK